MKNKSNICLSLIAAVVMAIIIAGCGSHHSHERGTASDKQADAVNQADAVKNDYSIKYEWSEKPKIGSRTLKVTLTDSTGAPVDGADVEVSYDMPSMRGAHATKESMKRNSSGDYLVPIHFAMPGDWEIVISATKDGVEIASELIQLDI